MKKFIVFALIVLVGFFSYKYFFSTSANKGSFDENGKPKVIVFTMDNCGSICSDVTNFLKGKNIAFEEINTSNKEGMKQFEKIGGAGLPLTVIGDHSIPGNNLPEIETSLTEAYGMELLTPAEQMAMKNHFDDKGGPIVAMYGTDWCPYCKKLRQYFEENKIPYTYLDVEKSDSAKMNYQTLKGQGYPLTYVGYRRIVGFDQAKISKAVSELIKN